MADYYGEDEGFGNWDATALVDNDQAKFELGVQMRTHTIIAIDCHPANILRKVLVPIPNYDPLTHVDVAQEEKDFNIPKGKKIISQLEYVLHTVICALRNNILNMPDGRFGTIFYNLPITPSQPEGIKVLQHHNKSNLHLLNKTYILDLLKIQHKEDFIRQFGICPWLEGTTPFSSVLNKIKHVFHQDTPPNYPASRMERRVWLFTPFQDPTRVPFEVFRRRVRNNYTLKAKFRGVERDLNYVKGEWQKDFTATKRYVENDPYDYTVFPLLSALPGLFNENELSSNDQGFAFYNSLEFRTESEIFANQDLQRTLSRYLPSFTKDKINDVFKAKNALPDSQFAGPKPGGSLAARFAAKLADNSQQQQNSQHSMGSGMGTVSQGYDGSYGNDSQTQSRSGPLGSMGASADSQGGDYQYSLYQQQNQAAQNVQNPARAGGPGLNDLVSLTDGGASSYNYSDSYSQGVGSLGSGGGNGGGSLYGGQDTSSIPSSLQSLPMITGNQLQKLAMERNRFSPEPFIMELGLYQDDLNWLKKSLVSAIGGANKTPIEIKQEEVKREMHQSRMGDDDDDDDDENQDNGQQKPVTLTIPSITTLLAHFQDTMAPDERSKKNKATTQLSWDPTFFEALYPDANIQAAIVNARDELNALALNGVTKTMKKRALTSIPLYLPKNPWSTDRSTTANSLFMGFDLFTQYVETKLQASNDCKLDPNNKSLVKSQTIDASSSGEALTKEDKTNYIPIGGKNVLFFTKEDVAKVKQFGPGSLRVIGFHHYNGTIQDLTARILPRDRNIQKPYFCAPNDLKYPGSSTLCADLIQMCYAKNQVILAQFIPKAGMPPRLVYLLPTIETHVDPIELLSVEDTDKSYFSGFQLIYVPYAEDIRDTSNFPVPATNGEEFPEDVAESLCNVIDQYQYKAKINRRGEIGALEPDCIFSPTMLTPLHKLQIRNSILESRAIGITDQNPPDRLQLGPEMQHVDEAVKQFTTMLKEAFPGIGEEKVKIPRGKKAAVTADGGDTGGAAATKPKTATKRTAAKARDENEGLADDEDVKPKRTARGKKAAAVPAEGGDVDEEEEAAKPAKKTTARGKKAAAKVEDGIHDSGDEAPKKTTRARAPAKKKAKEIESESDYGESSDEKPKKTTRGRKAVVKKEEIKEETTPTSTRSGRLTQRVRMFNVDESSDSSSESEVEIKKPKGRGRAVKMEVQEDEEEAAPKRSTRARK